MKKLICILLAVLTLTLNVTTVFADTSDLSIQTKDGIFKYDGNTHQTEVTVTGTDASLAVITYSTSSDNTNWSAYSENVPTITNAGKLYVKAKATVGSTSVEDDYTLEVLKRKVVVTTSSSMAHYNLGSVLTNSSITVSGDGFVEGEMATGYPKANGVFVHPNSFSEVMSIYNTIEYSWAGNGNVDNYSIIENKGKLFIYDKGYFVITSNCTYIYDGSPKGLAVLTNIGGATITYSTSSDDTNWSTYSETVPTITNAGKLYIKVKAEEGSKLAECSGTITIEKRDLIINTGSAVKEYDGTASTCGNYTIDGYANSEEANITITPCLTDTYTPTTLIDVGSCDNVITNIESNNNFSPQNYNVNCAKGKLTIYPKKVEVKADDKNYTLGDSIPTFTASVSGLIGTDTVDYSFKTINPSKMGVYSIVPSGEQIQNNYNVSYKFGRLIAKPQQGTLPDVDFDKLVEILDAYSAKSEYKDKILDIQVITNDTVDQADKILINDARASGSNVIFINTELHLIVNDGVNPEEDKNIGDENTVIIPITYEFDYDNTQIINILRVHDEVLDEITKTPNTDGEYFTYNELDKTVTIYAKKYSTYAITYSKVVNQPYKVVSTGVDGSNNNTLKLISLISILGITTAIVSKKKKH